MRRAAAAAVGLFAAGALAQLATIRPLGSGAYLIEWTNLPARFDVQRADHLRGSNWVTHAQFTWFTTGLTFSLEVADTNAARYWRIIPAGSSNTPPPPP